MNWYFVNNNISNFKKKLKHHLFNKAFSTWDSYELISFLNILCYDPKFTSIWWQASYLQASLLMAVVKSYDFEPILALKRLIKWLLIIIIIIISNRNNHVHVMHVCARVRDLIVCGIVKYVSIEFS